MFIPWPIKTMGGWKNGKRVTQGSLYHLLGKHSPLPQPTNVCLVVFRLTPDRFLSVAIPWLLVASWSSVLDTCPGYKRMLLKPHFIIKIKCHF
jgi:hypothetical protein